MASPGQALLVPLLGGIVLVGLLLLGAGPPRPLPLRRFALSDLV